MMSIAHPCSPDLLDQTVGVTSLRNEQTASAGQPLAAYRVYLWIAPSMSSNNE